MKSQNYKYDGEFDWKIKRKMYKKSMTVTNLVTDSDVGSQKKSSD